MEILKFPSPNLLTKCKNVNSFGPELKTLLDHMWETMKLNKGIGLASNQVGLSYNMFVMEGSSKERFNIINPKVVSLSKIPANLAEGCLSAPGEILLVPSRSIWISITFYDENGKEQYGLFRDIQAVCVQHEIEHLNGKSFLQASSLPKSVKKILSKKWGL
jgi:peptide deformylase